MNVADLTPEELVDALRRWAAGDLSRMAAVDLLIAHRHWLIRAPFRAAVDVWQPTATLGKALPPLAAVHFEALETRLDTGEGLHDTGSERAILAIACSLASGYGVPLGDALTSLDQTNVRLVAQAVLTAGGAS